MNQTSLLFGITIDLFSVTNWEDKKPKLLELVQFDDEDIESCSDCLTDYYRYDTRPPYFDSFVEILWDDLDNIAQTFTQGLSDKYAGECPLESVDKWQLWSQRYTKGQYHGAHNHGNNNISCVLYLEFDETEHIPTTFYCPFPHPYYGIIGKQTPSISEGNIVAFPSTLLHECPAQSSTTQRTIMAFNIPLR
tara:strand:+ start:80 stop:655 length:576 start_codon:yes stop_codon:yes gene_type:complete